MFVTKPKNNVEFRPLLSAMFVAGGLMMCASATVFAGELLNGNSRVAADDLPLDDPWITFCLIHSKPGKDLDNCILGLPSIADGSNNLSTSDSDVYLKYQNLVKTVKPTRATHEIEKLTIEQPVYEFISGCGVHFSSGEHPLSVRCKLENSCLGAFSPDVVLSVQWDKLLWDNDNNTVTHGAPEGCAIALELDQIPSTAAACGQQIVNTFNQSASCGAAGMSAVLTNAPAGTFIDVYYSPENESEMSIPGPESVGTVTY
jgi:hypothetical protein